MGILNLLLLAVGLSMDAFAVAICKGLAFGRVKPSSAITVGLYFGVFQALMPAVGFFLAVGFQSYIEKIDHWVAFGLLAFLGARMIIEAVRHGDGDEVSSSLDVKEMLLLAVATSIDALAAGISLALMGANIAVAAPSIGAVTFVLSAAGVYVGGIFGEKYKSPAEIAGGAVLILLGVKVLLEHLLG